MMNGISSGIKMSKSTEETTVNGDWLSILKGLEREEIEELFCHHCQPLLQSRLQSIANRKRIKNLPISSPGSPDNERCSESFTHSVLESSSKNVSIRTPENAHSGNGKRYADKFSPASVDSNNSTSSTESKSGRFLDDGIRGLSSVEELGFANVGRKNNFVHMERVNGKNVNVLQGLELHTRVFNAEEQKKIVESVYEFQRMGQRGRLREKTYSEPAKWMRGKGRVTIQFGCCYNYAIDKNGNPPGILRNEEVDPLPSIFKQMIKRMVRWHVLPPTCVPNSCIVNIYEEGDCIPPHIDHHDFLRPFCTISFLTECNILFGSNLKIVGPGEFAGPVSIPLPTGSVLILKGNGADVAKHCVPAVPAKRISITFRRMDESKIPYSYSPDPELQNLQPMVLTPSRKPALQQSQIVTKEASPPLPRAASKPSGGPSFMIGENDFPPLGVGNGSQQRGQKKNVFKS